MTKILITEAMADAGVKLLSREDDFLVDIFLGLSHRELKDKIAHYDALLVRSQTKVDSELLNHAPHLKLIGRAGVGLDNIDIDTAQRKNITVINSPLGNSISTAEMALLLILSLARKLPWAHQHVKNGEWQRNQFNGIELYGKTLGIIGYGNVGKHLAHLALAFHMNILAYDPLVTQNDEKIKLVDLNTLLGKADFISLHTSLNESTKHMINDHTIGMMKKGSMLINTARGELIDNQALIRGLDNNNIAMAAIDVFINEPPINDPLVNHPKILVSPHLGASTKEAQEKVAIMLAEKTLAFFKE